MQKDKEALYQINSSLFEEETSILIKAESNERTSRVSSTMSAQQVASAQQDINNLPKTSEDSDIQEEFFEKNDDNKDTDQPQVPLNDNLQVLELVEDIQQLFNYAVHAQVFVTKNSKIGLCSRNQFALILRTNLLVFICQEVCLGILIQDTYSNFNFYKCYQAEYLTLRYLLLSINYYLFCKDYRSVSQSVLFTQKLHIENQVRNGQDPQLTAWSSVDLWSTLKLFFAVLNQGIVAAIICSSKLSDGGSLGLITNFSAVLIVCELDDIFYSVVKSSKLKKEMRLTMVKQFQILRNEAIAQFKLLQDPEIDAKVTVLDQSNDKDLSATEAAKQQIENTSYGPVDEIKAKRIIQAIQGNVLVMNDLSQKFKHLNPAKLNMILQTTPDQFNVSTEQKLEDKFMTVTIDETKVNGKYLNLLPPSYVCKFVFLMSFAYLIYSDVQREPNLLGINEAGYRVTASSSYPNYEPLYSKLDSDNKGLFGRGSAWCPQEAKQGQYIQISSESDEYWDHIMIQGAANEDKWVTFVAIYESSDLKEFNLVDNVLANTDSNSKTKITLSGQETAKAIRLQPILWNNFPCLRFEAYIIQN
ncbi:UNKNOWN [Stylonychia lemnae]|uniref:F5/8 type C domain-containing protein n=1 Tax=Stylonychia lemnae TaxID=5949 RepID=A0A077ZYD8_STYLE|nr:UNKNOWN [Stylonychia lemnae]|eukprot:CDW74870.1 UNKNOWN [Stylonychia lemnae]